MVNRCSSRSRCNLCVSVSLCLCGEQNIGCSWRLSDFVVEWPFAVLGATSVSLCLCGELVRSLQEQTMESTAYSPGLEGVIAGVTAISSIDTERNVLTYRGYDVQELCDHSSFEEVAYLLLYGELPNSAALAVFDARLKAEREPPAFVYDVIRLLPPRSEPMDWLKVAVAALALTDPAPHDNSRQANLDRAIRLT